MSSIKEDPRNLQYGFLFLFREGVQKIHGLKGWKAAQAGTAGFVGYQGFSLIFNR